MTGRNRACARKGGVTYAVSFSKACQKKRDRRSLTEECANSVNKSEKKFPHKYVLGAATRSALSQTTSWPIQCCFLPSREHESNTMLKKTG